METPFQALDVMGDDEVGDRDQLLVPAVHGQARGSQALSQHVNGSIGQREDVRDLGVSDEQLFERDVELQDGRLMNRNDQFARMQRSVDLFDQLLGVRLRIHDDRGAQNGGEERHELLREWRFGGRNLIIHHHGFDPVVIRCPLDGRGGDWSH